MQTITFYSYKGGTGRTLALANVAMLLAEMGKCVFVLDCDLEAPGLHYKLLKEERRKVMRPGFIDLSYEYFQRDGFKPVMEYVEEIDPIRHKELGGKILLMPAGQPLGPDYWNRLVKINWPERFYEEYGEGFLFLLELKRRIEKECQPDFLLIDARTGVTEVGGVALTLLPDQIVVLFVNNDESKEGTREILRSIPRSLPEGEKLPVVVPVLTRVPEDMSPLLEELRGYFNEQVPGDVTPPKINRVLALRSDRGVELRESLLLSQPAQQDSVLYRDYVELFRALSLVPESELLPYVRRALEQEATDAIVRGDMEELSRLSSEAELAKAHEANVRAHEAAALSIPVTLPTRRPRLVRGGPEIASFSVHLAVVTPILGGATRPREIDTVDVIRVPSLRGQLRFWWRALYGAQLPADRLYDAERRLWGGAADDDGGRSDVEIRVTLKSAGAVDPSDIRPYGRDATPGAYALWPAREARGDNPQPTAPRRVSGTRFVLDVRCPKRDETIVRNAVRALILFGGYGGRTRRGAGTLTVERAADRAAWLPAAATRSALVTLFGWDVLGALPDRAPDDLPVLRGAWLRVGAPVPEPSSAWLDALGWLSEFRQGQPPPGASSHDARRYARVRGDQRPGRSNWPEADKVRRLSGRGPWAHEPRHNDRPAWPRAGFGLPILAQFQRKDRSGGRYRDPEPESYELRWHGVSGQHDRLASPLVVKALPLADGRFAPCALWLYRGYPSGKVGLKANDARSSASRADFDILVASGDQALFAPLEAAKDAPRGMRLRAAFFKWLEQQRSGIVVVAP